LLLDSALLIIKKALKLTCKIESKQRKFSHSFSTQKSGQTAMNPLPPSDNKNRAIYYQQ
jgi:hypothetical protein